MNDAKVEKTNQIRQELAVHKAAERLYAQVLAMEREEDLFSLVAALLKEINHVGVDSSWCSIDFADSQKEQINSYQAYERTLYKPFTAVPTNPKVRFDKDIIMINRYLSWDANEKIWLNNEVSISRLNYDSYFLLGSKMAEAMGTELTLMETDLPKGAEILFINVPFRYGTIGFESIERQAPELAETKIGIIRHLAEPLSLGYQRVLDFQRLEGKKQNLEQALEEKEQAQEALVRSESMAAIGTLVAGAAHELNNPLGAAASLVQSVQEMVEDNTAEELEQDRAMIIDNLAFSRKELDRAKEIVASLLGLSRQSQSYTEEVDLTTVVQDALRVLHNKYKRYEVDLAEDYQGALPMVLGNFAQLGQVALNLIENAVEAVGEGEGQIRLRTYSAGDQVVFECGDTGPGMPEAVRQDIFKPFFTTKAPGQGTGLGLYICHQIVEKHGGAIEVESTLGQGTAFKVILPRPTSPE